MKNLIKEIMDSRKNFTEETRPVGLDEKCIIDTVDICEALARYQVTDFSVGEYDDNGEFVDHEFDNLDDYLDYLENMYGLSEAGSDNSYNWSAPVTNHFNFYAYKDTVQDKLFVEFKVHLFGDVRANYTKAVLLEFDSLDEFYSVIYGCSKTVRFLVNDCEFNAEIDAFSNGFEFYDEKGSYLLTVNECCDEDIIEELAKYTVEELGWV